MAVRSGLKPVIKGLVTKLGAASWTTTPAIVTNVQERQTAPYIVIDASNSVPDNAFDGHGERLAINLHIWDDNPDDLLTLWNEAQQALDYQTLALDYGEFGDCQYDGGVRIVRDSEGDLYQLVARFQIRVHQLQT